jgi:hypothetical protein
VKFLVDTPEAIWGLQDSSQPLAAARRYEAAGIVHRALSAARPDVVKRQFPVVQGTWTAIQSKKADILKGAEALLQAGAPVERVRAFSIPSFCRRAVRVTGLPLSNH